MLNCPIYGNDPLGNADYNAASVTAAAGVGSTMVAANGAQLNAIVQDAVDVSEEVELGADYVGAAVEDDSVATLEAVQRGLAQLKDYAVAIGKEVNDIGLRDQQAAKDLGYSTLNLDRGWTEEVNSLIMDSLIQDKRQIYMSSVVNLSNYWKPDGSLSAYAQELLQFLDARYTRAGYDMYPPP